MIALHIGGDGVSTWAAWSLDPIALVLVPLSAWLYARGLARSQGSRRQRHPAWRPAAFYAALATIFVALVSPLDRLADELFLAHMVQHLLLVSVAPPLLLLSAPMIPVLRGVPRGVRRALVIPGLKSPLVRVPLRFVAQPLVAWPLYVTALLAWHIPNAFELALRNPAAHLLEHVIFLGTAVLWWWNVVDPVPLKPNLSYLARVPYIFLTTVPVFVLGAFLTFSPSAWYGHYSASTPDYGLTPLEDQQLGGIIMWIPGSLILMTALLIVLLFVVHTEARQQRERETRLTPGT